MPTTPSFSQLPFAPGAGREMAKKFHGIVRKEILKFSEWIIPPFITRCVRRLLNVIQLYFSISFIRTERISFLTLLKQVSSLLEVGDKTMEARDESDVRRNHKPRSAGSLQKLEKARK